MIDWLKSIGVQNYRGHGVLALVFGLFFASYSMWRWGTVVTLAAWGPALYYQIREWVEQALVYDDPVNADKWKDALYPVAGNAVAVALVWAVVHFGLLP